MSLASRLISLTSRVASEIKAVRGVADSKVPLSSVGVASGIATLDATGKLSSAQVPDLILGALKYQGIWDAGMNSPTIPAAGVANKGWYYIVSTAGATNVSGVTDWQIGDWLVSNGTAWNKIDNTDQVMSVAGLQGAISAASLKTALAIAAGDVSGLGTAATQPSTAFAASSHVGAGGAAHAAATTSVSGFMTASDKVKLNGIATGAEVNAVTSVAGKTGAVSLTASDVGAQASNANLTTLAGLTLAANKLPYGTGAGAMSLTDLSAFARSILDDTSGLAVWQTMGGLSIMTGYTKLPNGLIVQWGIAGNAADADFVVTFPTAFPSGVGAVMAVAIADPGTSTFAGVMIDQTSKTSFAIRRRGISGGVVSASTGFNVYWTANGT